MSIPSAEERTKSSVIADPVYEHAVMNRLSRLDLRESESERDAACSGGEAVATMRWQ